MARQIKNRREDLYIKDVPPEILDETALSADGFVKDTDYATDTTGGVIKTSSGAATATSSTGALIAVSRTASQYASANNNIFISKGTLENIIASLIIKVFATEADPSGEAEDGTKWDFSLYKQNGEYIWLVEQHLNP